MNEVNDKLLLNNNKTSTTITTINNNINNRIDNKLKSSKLLNYILSIICLILITSLLIIIITNLKCINKLKCQTKINNESSLELNLITYLPTTTATTTNATTNTAITTTININDDQQEQFNSKWNNSRLPKHLKPFHYDINLKIDVYNKSFVGNCTIHFKCLETTSLLVVHSDSNIIFLNKKIPDIYEIDSNNFTHRIRKIYVNSVETNLFFNYLIIQLDSNELFKKDVHYTVVFQNYYSEITNNLKGLYYSTYMTKSGILKYI
jgi:hypothetical protein